MIKLKVLQVLLGVLLLENDATSHRVHVENFSPAVPQIFKYAKNFFPKKIGKFLGFTFSQTGKDSYAYLTESSDENPVDIAKDFLESSLFLTSSEYSVTNSYKSNHNGVTHVYFVQLHNDIEIANAFSNINIDKAGRVISFGSSFLKNNFESEFPGGGKQIIFNSLLKRSFAPINPIDAFLKLAKHLKLPDSIGKGLYIATPYHSGSTTDEIHIQGSSIYEPVPVKQKYIQVYENGASSLRLVWDIETEMEENWLNAHVDCETGAILSVIDWVSDASYEVYPLGVNDPSEGERSLVTDPHYEVASPLGWHAIDNKTFYSDTRGNNAMVQENLSGRLEITDKNQRPDGGVDLKFEFPLDLSDDPRDYLNASVTNLFYWNNIIHDLFYKFGFDEKSGNFQKNNFGRGGKGNDEVIANAQDGSGYNNANFATPPDGKNGKMRMYVWTASNPKRDGDLEGGIIIHEYAHGISNRLTGGPANSNCLGFGEAGGMGEGWGDFWATILRIKKSHTREDNFSMGSYSANSVLGIRRYPYSTSLTMNPSTYAFIKKREYGGVHAKGEVWAAILYEVFWNLVDKNGFSSDIFNDPVLNGKKNDKVAGNIMALQLTVDGLKFQPCNPSFVDARDAIIQADQANYDGDNFCEIWKGFAKRGLGIKAKKGGIESFDVPKECEA
jgi:extracellular elastinolytic metalloproteinase